MDSYADMSDVENCFVEFMDKVPFYGAVTACVDDERLRGILPRVRRRVYTYGVGGGGGLSAADAAGKVPGGDLGGRMRGLR